MNRKEALRILGLDEDASSDDIKTAYRECAQILHPDRFASNKKLQERATEQFKRLQEAYDYLTSGTGSRSGKRGASRGGQSAARSGASPASGYRPQTSSGYTAESELEARLAGIAAARAQLVAQRDTVLDERSRGLGMLAIGGIVALVTIRRPFGLFGVVAAIASTAAVWGIVQIISAQSTITNINEHLAQLNKEKKKIMRKLEELEDADDSEDIENSENEEDSTDVDGP